jgi:hypothetical protein
VVDMELEELRSRLRGVIAFRSLLSILICRWMWLALDTISDGFFGIRLQ